MGKLLNIGGSLAFTVGIQNHLLYRGYYYDNETGMYYLQSRYYDPELCRFISRDDASYHEGETGAAANLYAYCNNDPVNYVDFDGHAAANIIGGIIGGISGTLLGLLIANALGLTGAKKWILVAAIAVAGVVLGAILGPYIARLTKHVVSIINSGIRIASSAAFKAAAKVSQFVVKSKHLINGRGNWSKFNTASQTIVRQ